MILLVEQPINNHEHAHIPLFCNQSEDYCQKMKKLQKVNTTNAITNSTYISTPLKVHLHTHFSNTLSYVCQLHQTPCGFVYTR